MSEAAPQLGSGAGSALDAPRLLPPVELLPEKGDKPRHWLEPIETATLALANRVSAPFYRRRLKRMTRSVARCERRISALDDEGLAGSIVDIRAKLRRYGLEDEFVCEALALIREQSYRILGQRHHDVQILGGLAMLDGALAEMATGEGKTLTATLAAGTAALSGIPVHIVTVNDYLAERDAQNMGPLLERLGLTVGVIKHGLSLQERQKAYACDIVYASNKEIAFDYLRDRVRLGGPPRSLYLKLRRLQGDAAAGTGLAQRGLHYAIVDEADSVLIDEARTPLIISQETDAAAEREWAEQAHALADELEEPTHYRIQRDERRVVLTEAGREHLANLGALAGGLWENRIRREEAVRQALSARLLFDRDDHYVVRDGKVQIVDEYTGRIMDERSWSNGLHQLVESKEGVEVTSRKMPTARMTYQRFMRRYQRLAGMTGTASEVAGEFWAVYRLRVVSIPYNLPPKSRRYRSQICRTQDRKWDTVVVRARELHEKGRPILIGTRSVATSEIVSARLTEAGLAHDVLSATQDTREAVIIAGAGDPGRITVATNMAGRGVDIAISPKVIEKGGLHVILTERHDSKRIDRQLEGRVARRGQPGSTEAILALDDALLGLLKSPVFRALKGSVSVFGTHKLLFKVAQRRTERTHSRARRSLLKYDRRLGTLLAFTGKPE
jgi:preprotein translocase subunit SecA